MLIDSHTHLDGFHRTGELPAIIERAREAGVSRMITIGTEPGDWSLYRELAAAHPETIHYTVGLHPCSVDESWRPATEQLQECLAADPRPVAIGETGLDRFHLPKDAAKGAELFSWQKDSFRVHLDLAREAGLPVVVHSRGAASECIALIDESGFDWSRIVFHCFADGPETIRELNRRGGRGSFTGIATYKSAGNVREAALAQGIARMMIETDAPYLTPEPHRGKRNEPAFVAHTATALARLFAVPPDDFAAATVQNTREFFRI